MITISTDAAVLVIVGMAVTGILGFSIGWMEGKLWGRADGWKAALKHYQDTYDSTIKMMNDMHGRKG